MSERSANGKEPSADYADWSQYQQRERPGCLSNHRDRLST
jgi:hypothetical protein